MIAEAPPYYSNRKMSGNLSTWWEGAKNDYDIAKRSRFKKRRKGLAYRGASADYHYRNEGEFLNSIEIARELRRNDPIVGQGIRRLVANIVQGGINPDPSVGDHKLDADLKARWTEWAGDRSACSTTGELDFPDDRGHCP